jgi:uncharacterized protein (TIGR03435 family)
MRRLSARFQIVAFVFTIATAILIGVPRFGSGQAARAGIDKAEAGYGGMSSNARAKPATAINFDVVSIKIDKTDARYGVSDPPEGDGITLNMPMFDVVCWTYDLYSLREEDVHNVPGWFKTEHYNIEAKIAESDLPAWHKLTEAERRLVFRKVLFDRFNFAMHFVNAEEPIFHLVLVKNGRKVNQVSSGDPNPDRPKAPDGTPIRGQIIRMIGPDKFSFQEVTMTFLAKWLSGTVGRPVYDQTGLPSNALYDFTLGYNWQEFRKGSINPDSAPESESNAPSLFQALQDQAGLKLDPARGPVQHPVIDHIERPTPN